MRGTDATAVVLMMWAVAVAAAQPGEELPPPRPAAPRSPLDNTRPLPPDPTTVIPQPLGHAAPAADPVLRLAEVLASVESHYPLLIAAEQERVSAQGKLVSAWGGFDTSLNGFDRGQVGSYPSHRFNVGLAQPLGPGGIDTYAGYRISEGDFPVYYGDRFTGDGGEFRAGVNVPLLRDRAIDKRRAALRQALLGREAAEPSIYEKRLDYLQRASLAYWAWVGTAHRFAIAQQLLRLAEQRDEYLRKRAVAGAVPEIDVTDNRRLIVDRRTRLVAFQRRYEQASIDLSLFLRDDTGRPQRPDGRRTAPPFPEPVLPAVDQLPADVELALKQRPELRQLHLRRAQVEVDLELAKNQMLPAVDVFVNGAQDVGKGKKDLDRTTYEAGVAVDVPLQRRDARGKILVAQAERAKLMAQFQYAREQIEAEVQNLLSALVRAYEVRQRARQNVELAETMQQAEERRLDLGQSNLIFVNLRELATADARLLEVDGLVDYFRALADYRAALGVGAPAAPH